MERETTVSVKLEAKDEVLMVPRTMVLRSAAMESRGTVSVKCEPTDEILTVPRALVNGHYEPACHLCGCAERDIEEALRLGKEASDISADVLLANMHIKKEQEDISDQKVNLSQEPPSSGSPPTAMPTTGKKRCGRTRERTSWTKKRSQLADIVSQYLQADDSILDNDAKVWVSGFRQLLITNKRT
ncbi:uncharacterized protein LOC124719907 isoform X2 [Schistocerca piceifrons]|nr:uncharacterized protein LOC124719907 isoform X2 [Schistocerca piceifrons]